MIAIHHIDGNPHNNDDANLQIVGEPEEMKRLRLVAQGFDRWDVDALRAIAQMMLLPSWAGHGYILNSVADRIEALLPLKSET